ncbi:MAG: AsmA family protein [Arenicellales bacterium WSBS_2016_MAG_OTU3]
MIYLAASNIDVTQIHKMVAERVEKRIGRTLSISDELDLKFYPVPVITIAALTLANVEGGEADYYARISDVTVYPHIWALLKGDIEIGSVSAGSAELNLERYADGSNNWTLPSKRRYRAPVWVVDSLKLQNGSLTFNDAVTAKTWSAKIDTLDAFTQKNGSIKGFVTGSFQGLPVSANVELSDFEHLFTKTPTTGSLQGTLASAAVNARGSIGHMLSFSDIDLNTTVTGLEIEAVEKIFGFDLPITGSLNTSARLKGSVRNMDAEELTASLKIEDGILNAAGRVSGLFRALKTELVVAADISSVQSVLAHFDQKLPVDGKLNARGLLSGENKQFSLLLDGAELSNEKLSAKASGRIADLNKLQRVSLDVSGHASSLAAINQDMAESFRLFAPVTFSAKLSRDKKVTGLQNIVLKIAENGKTIELNGELSDIVKRDGFNATIDVTSSSLDVLSKHIGVDLPATGEVSVQTVLHRKNVNSKLELEVDVYSDDFTLRVQGDVMPESSAETVDLVYALEANHIQPIKTWLQLDLPELNNINANGSIVSLPHSTGGEGGLYQLDVNLSADGMNANFNGVADKARQSLQGKINLDAADVALLKPVVDTGGFLKGAVHYQSEIRYSPRLFEFKQLALDAGKVKAIGEVKIIPAVNDQVAVISGRIEVEQMDFRTPKADSSVANNESTKQAAQVNKRIFSSERLPVEALQKKTLDVELTIQKIFTDVTQFHDAHFQISLKNNRLSVPGFFVGVGLRGHMHGEFALDVSSAIAGMDLSINTIGIAPESLSWFGSGDLVREGSVGLDTELSGSGNTIAEIMSNLNGYILVDIEKSLLRQKGLKLIGGDLLTKVIRLVNPFDKKRKDIRIFCGVVGFNVKDGKARTSEGIAIKASDLALFGAGEIDFENEKLKIVIKPKARKGLGISASSIAKFVRIGGSLANPKTEGDPKSLLSTSASVGAAVASGGVSLIAQGIYDRLKASGDICEKARKKFRDEIVVTEKSEKQKSVK